MNNPLHKNNHHTKRIVCPTAYNPAFIYLLAGTVLFTLLVHAQGGKEATSPIERLGQPCRAKQILAGRIVVDRADGRERFVLANDNETYGCELLFIDFENDVGEMYPAPAGAGSWALLEVPGDRLVVGTFYDGKFMVFDLNKKKFSAVADFKEESYIWNLVLGGDGRVYGGTYPGGKLGALDLDTYTVIDCGAPAPPNLYLRSVMPAPCGKVVCYFMMDKPTTLVFDPATKTFGPLPGLAEGETVSSGVRLGDYFIASVANGGLKAWAGPQLECIACFPVPGVNPAEGWGLCPLLCSDSTVFLSRGESIYRFDLGDQEPRMVTNANLRGGTFYAVSKTGALLGVRGQDYVVVKPGEDTVSLRPIPVESRGRPSLFLEADDRGRIWGGPHFGQTLFWYDTATGETVNTGVVCDHGGEVYDVAFLDGKVYATSYSGGDISVYDPSEPWDQWDGKNPKPLAHVRPEYIRPVAGITCGPDGFLYSGWMAKYGTYGGCLARTDPKTGETTIWPNPVAEQAIASFDVDKDYIYFATSLSANGLPDKTPPVFFAVWDIVKEEVVFRHEFDQKQPIGPIAALPGTQKVYVNTGDKLLVYDKDRRGFSGEIGLGRSISTPRIVIKNGKMLFGQGNNIMCLDPATGERTVIATAPGRVSLLTCAADGALYFMCEAELYRVGSWQ